MNILRVDFQELYQRHLCRHGQLGINLWHAIAVYGVYFSVYSLAAVLIRTLLPNSSPVEYGLLLIVLSLPYLAVLIFNVPVAVMLLTLASTGLLIVGALMTSMIPFWMHLILIPAWHRVQLVSHKKYTCQRDMLAFEVKYRKGWTLFLLLAVYELPILLQYLVYGRNDWIR